MKYTEEEKEAIEVAKEIVDKKYGSIMVFEIRDMEKILNLLDKQQKEIEALKQENEYLNCVCESDADNFINKDKIREKIEEYAGLKEIDIKAYDEQIRPLKELLGE